MLGDKATLVRGGEQVVVQVKGESEAGVVKIKSVPFLLNARQHRRVA